MIHTALHFRYLITTFIVFLLLILSTIIAWKITADVTNQEIKHRLDLDTQNIKNMVDERFSSYAGFLYGSQGFFESSEDISKKDWSAYISRTKIIDRYPGLSSVGYVQRVKYADKQKFIDSVRRDKSATSSSYTNFTIHPDTKKEEYYVIKYLEPDTGRANALGFDTSSEEKRFAALIRSRDTGDIASSGRVTTASTGKPGFALTAPIYKKGVDLQSMRARHEGLIGFVILNFRLYDSDSKSVFQSIFHNKKQFENIDFEIYDSNIESEDHLLYDYDPETLTSIIKTDLKINDHIKIDGQEWTLSVAPKKDSLTDSQKLLPIIVLISGLAFSFIFLVLFFYRLSQHLKTHKQSTT